ncbi:MAG TPA: hypothetical protein VNE62_07355 [Actinomycetota bacterium]|nr:hypothetical protein [Actinomycetota bacterium]
MNDEQRAPEVPSGTVTLLMADTERSVEGWESDRAAMTSAVARLDELVDEAVARHSGVRPLEQGAGDSFVAAFSRATDALACGLNLQLAIGAEQWRTPKPLRVRMAMHTGEVQLRDSANYVGSAANRTGRLRDLAHGGQVLVSGTTRDLVVDDLPGDCALQDLGLHGLKGFSRPEHVWQLCHRNLADQFPPLRGDEQSTHNLPVPVTSFIGRETELEEVLTLVGENRLVTLTGSGGAGKTRLAIEAAGRMTDNFPDGIWFIDLSAVSVPSDVETVVASTLGFTPDPGPTTSSLASRLADTKALLVVDNCEHVIDACATLVHSLLAGTRDMRILATSRQSLEVDGELVWRVPSLPVPDDDEAVPTGQDRLPDAIRLFVDRARRARPSFDLTKQNASAVATVCRRLDGIPLAIELAAARVRVLSPEQIADALDDRFRVLGAGPRTALPRQSTLSASVEWSYDLLRESEQVLLRRLSVFAGGFDLAAAEGVCGFDPIGPLDVLDLLDSLAQKSLVQPDDAGAESRYRLLETIRQFALDRLKGAGEEDALRTRHLEYFANLSQSNDSWSQRTHDRTVLLRREGANLWEALRWAQQPGLAEHGLRLAIPLARPSAVVGPLNIPTGVHHAQTFMPAWRHTLETLLELSPDAPASLRARAYWSISWLATFFGDIQTQLEMSAKALPLARASGDDVTAALCTAVNALAISVVDPAAAAPLAGECAALAESSGEPFAVAHAHFLGGIAALHLGDWSLSRSRLERAVQAAGTGEFHTLGPPVCVLGTMEMLHGKLDSARERLRFSLHDSERMRFGFWIAFSTATTALLEAVAGRPDEALATSAKAESAAEEMHESSIAGYAGCWTCIARLLAADYEGALERSRLAAGHLRRLGVHVYLQLALMVQYESAKAMGLIDEAASALAEMQEVCTQLGTNGFASFVALHAARAARAEGDPQRAHKILVETLLAPEGTHVPMTLIPMAETLAGLETESGRAREAAVLMGAAQAARDRTGLVRWPHMDDDYASGLNRVRRELDVRQLEAAWSEGAGLPLEQALSSVLSRVVPTT